jgi:hypothetical protein
MLYNCYRSTALTFPNLYYEEFKMIFRKHSKIIEVCYLSTLRMTSAVMLWSYKGYLSLSMVALSPTMPTSVMNLQPVFLPPPPLGIKITPFIESRNGHFQLVIKTPQLPKIFID